MWERRKTLGNKTLRLRSKVRQRLLLPIPRRLLTHAEAASPVRGVRGMHEIRLFSTVAADGGHVQDARFARRASISLPFPCSNGAGEGLWRGDRLGGLPEHRKVPATLTPHLD
jgi:hypothetical protein